MKLELIVFLLLLVSLAGCTRTYSTVPKEGCVLDSVSDYDVRWRC